MMDFLKLDIKPGETGYTTGRTRWTAFKKFLAKKILNQELEMMEKNGELPPKISNELTKNNVIAEIVSTNQKILASRNLALAVMKMKAPKDPADWPRLIAQLVEGTKSKRQLLSRKIIGAFGMEWSKKAEKLTELDVLREEVKAVEEIKKIARETGIDLETSQYSVINKNPKYQIEQKAFEIDALGKFAEINGVPFWSLPSSARSVITTTLGTNARSKWHRVNGDIIKLRTVYGVRLVEKETKIGDKTIKMWDIRK